MFITVKFGAGCQELMNPRCSLVNFTVHLKQKAQIPPEVTIALLAEDGHLVKLEEEVTQAPSMACSLLQEQRTYVLVQVITPTGFPGSSRGAVLAVRLSNHKQWSEKTHRHLAWPTGTRSLFQVSKGDLHLL
ncbi:uncharacterized protein C22orf15 homolog isoform X4 [Arvicanthis niloticus]|uniref:uncharacterized protein C22orf15 homolog isoform X4 n=1 Tax=Arvicanthis niloticus TaxID=61156 RepID=UPI00402B48B6